MQPIQYYLCSLAVLNHIGPCKYYRSVYCSPLFTAFHIAHEPLFHQCTSAILLKDLSNEELLVLTLKCNSIVRCNDSDFTWHLRANIHTDNNWKYLALTV